MELENFELLARKVDALISHVEELSQSHKELRRLINKKDGEIQRLKENVAAFEQERVKVRTRVDELLHRIDQHSPNRFDNGTDSKND